MRRSLGCVAAAAVAAAVALGVAWSISLGPGPGPAGLAPRWDARRFGVTWEVSGPVDAGDLDLLAATGANGIVQMPFPRMQRTDRPEVEPPDFRIWGQRDVGLRVTSRLARARGIATLLKPHITIVDRSSGFWPGQIRMRSDAEWKEWFRSYGAIVLHYAELAAEEGMEAFCVGAELRETLSHEAEWRALIAQVRERYPGCVMYSVNWDDYERFGFADAVDAIGVQAYFPISDALQPSETEIERGWDRSLQRFERWVERVGRPIVFTEVGFHSCMGSLDRPWEWHFPGMPPDFALQARAYDVTLRVLRGRPWLRGLYFWKWLPGRARPAPPDDTEFHPQGKPAEEIMRRHFREELGIR